MCHHGMVLCCYRQSSTLRFHSSSPSFGFISPILCLKDGLYFFISAACAYFSRSASCSVCDPCVLELAGSLCMFSSVRIIVFTCTLSPKVSSGTLRMSTFLGLSAISTCCTISPLHFRLFYFDMFGAFPMFFVYVIFYAVMYLRAFPHGVPRYIICLLSILPS